jgi:hypothetical protein
MGIYIGIRLCSRCSGYASGHGKPRSVKNLKGLRPRKSFGPFGMVVEPLITISKQSTTRVTAHRRGTVGDTVSDAG